VAVDRDALPLQTERAGVPSHGLFLLSLAQALEQPDSTPVGVESIDVVDDMEWCTDLEHLAIFRSTIKGRARFKVRGQLPAAGMALVYEDIRSNLAAPVISRAFSSDEAAR
jgi:hypothetical protein